MDGLKDELAAYVDVLAKSLAGTHRAEDRNLYMQHLAASALMFRLLQTGAPSTELERWLDDERRVYGWSCRVGAEGRAADAAFERFAAAVEQVAADH